MEPANNATTPETAQRRIFEEHHTVMEDVQMLLTIQISMEQQNSI